MREGRVGGVGRVRVQAGPRDPESRPGALSLQRCRCGSWATEPCHAIPRKPIRFSSHQSWTKPDLGSVQRHNRARVAAPVRANHAPGRNSYHCGVLRTQWACFPVENRKLGRCILCFAEDSGITPQALPPSPLMRWSLTSHLAKSI